MYSKLLKKMNFYLCLFALSLLLSVQFWRKIPSSIQSFREFRYFSKIKQKKNHFPSAYFFP